MVDMMDMVDVLDVVLASAGGVGGDVFISCVGCVGARLVAANAWGESKRASERRRRGDDGLCTQAYPPCDRSHPEMQASEKRKKILGP